MIVTAFIYSGIQRFIMRFPSSVKDYTEKGLSLDRRVTHLTSCRDILQATQTNYKYGIIRETLLVIEAS